MVFFLWVIIISLTSIGVFEHTLKDKGKRTTVLLTSLLIDWLHAETREMKKIFV